MDEQEAALHRRLLERDPGALDALVEAYSSQVYRIAGLVLGQTGSSQDVEEAAGDAFAAAWACAAEFDPERSTLRNWLLMLAKYATLNRRRALVREEARVIPLGASPEPALHATPEDELVRHERREHLHRALAQQLGLSRAAIDNLLWRARHALKALLADEREGHRNGTSAV